MWNVADGDLVRVGESEAHGHVRYCLDGEAVENTDGLRVHVGGWNLGDGKFHVECLSCRSLQGSN